MDGKDLFLALNGVEDELITEADAYAVHRVIPLQLKRFGGALAACICLLLGWAVFARFDLKADNTMLGRGTETAATEGAAEEAGTEEAVVTEETVEEAEAEREESVEEKSEDVAHGTPLFVGEDGVVYCVIAEAFPFVAHDEGNLKDVPQGGACLVAEELKKTAEQTALTQMNGVPRFLVAFDLYRDGEKIDPDSAEYAAEVQRLSALGYEFRTLQVEKRDRSVKVQTCALMTGGLLREKDLSAEYGYYLYFPENENGTPLDWNDEAELCGLPTAEDASVTRDYD